MRINSKNHTQAAFRVLSPVLASVLFAFFCLFPASSSAGRINGTDIFPETLKSGIQTHPHLSSAIHSPGLRPNAFQATVNLETQSSARIILEQHPLLILGLTAALLLLMSAVIVMALSILRRRRAERELNAIFENSLTGIVRFDNEGHISKANTRAAEILGCFPADLQGLHYRELFLSDTECRMFEDQFMTNLHERPIYQIEFPLKRRNGSSAWCTISGKALGKREQGLGMVWVLDDTSAYKLAREKLQESKTMLRETQRLAHLGGWEYDWERDRMVWTRETYRLTGYQPELKPTLQLALEMIDSKNREFVKQAMNLAHDQGQSFETDVKLDPPNGPCRWVRIQGSPYRDRQGKVKIRGTVRDISENRKSKILSSTLFMISNAVCATKNLDALYEAIHGILKKQIGSTNFFIAIVDKTRDCLDFPYFKDENDEYYTIDNISNPNINSLTVHVIRTGRPLHLNGRQMEILQRNGTIPIVGTIPKVWLGVPLNVGGRNIGAMAIQHYSDPDFFTAEDVDLMISVSEQTALAIGRKMAQDEIRKSEEMFRSLYENMRDGIASADLSGTITKANPALLEMLGYGMDELAGMNYREITPEKWYEREESIFLNQVMTRGYSDVYEKELIRKNGAAFPAEFRVYLLKDKNGMPKELWTTIRDITARKGMERQLKHQAMHDPLTSLPNRILCADRIARAAERSRRRKDYHFAVIFLDLDRFKLVNDNLGHAFGDELLIMVSKRLLSCVRDLDTVSRFGGDEFVILLEELETPGKTIQVIKRMRRELSKPYSLKDHEVQVASSFGIVFGPCDSEIPEKIVQCANIAMHRAKAKGRDRFKVFTPRLMIQAQSLLNLESDMDRAMAQGEFFLEYQPMIELKTNRLYGFEALARWNHPETGLVPPGDFIPVAEENGLINDLGLWILHEACSTMVKWNNAHPEALNLILSVNVSGQQFAQQNLVGKIKRILDKTRMPPTQLKLEITETALMSKAAAVIDKLNQLRELGITLSIDDFGTGYSSMSYLQRFPLDNLKIDSSFIRLMDTSQESKGIVMTIINLAHTLGLEAVAEGVEKEEHHFMLREMGCEYCQGYYYARPASTDAAEEYIKNRDVFSDKL